MLALGSRQDGLYRRGWRQRQELSGCCGCLMCMFVVSRGCANSKAEGGEVSAVGGFCGGPCRACFALGLTLCVAYKLEFEACNCLPMIFWPEAAVAALLSPGVP